MASEHSHIRARCIDSGVGAPEPVHEPDIVRAYSEDASGYPGAPASGLLRPASAEEAAAFLRATAGRGVRVLPQAARTSLTGGAVPRGEVILSCERWDRIGSVRSGSGTARVRVGTGVRLHALQAHLAALGWYFPPVPTYHEAMVGGVIATNAGGAATFKYGVTRNWVRAVRVLLANGDFLEVERGEALARPGGRFRIESSYGGIVEVPTPTHRLPPLPKISAGYFAADPLDLVDLMIGSEGTLALVVDADLDLVALPEAVVTGMAFVAGDAEALRLSEALCEAGRRARGEPESRHPDVRAVEFVDRHGLDLLRRHGDAERLRVNVPEEAGAAILFEVEIAGWMGREAAEAAILAALNGGGAVHDGPLFRLVRILAAHGPADATELVLPGDERRAASLASFREAVPKRVNEILAARHREESGVRKVGGDLIVPTATLADALGAWRRILERSGLDHATWGHVSDGNLHPNLLSRNAEEVGRAEGVLLELADDAMARGGAPLSEHGVGRSGLKQEMLRRFIGTPGIERMQAVKSALDPEWRLAPGVLFSTKLAGIENLA
jgi:D-lactate dehydrogenase (cytochrome)